MWKIAQKWNTGSGGRRELCDTIRGDLQSVLKRSDSRDQGLEFICETDVEKIWTEARVQSLSKGLSWDMPVLQQRAKKDFKRILSILVWIHWDRWDDFKRIFLDQDHRGDSELPLPDNLVPNEHGMRQPFSRDQYIFSPVTLLEESRHEVTVQPEYERQFRMPFLQSTEIGNGATGVVTKELIAAKHFRYQQGYYNSEPMWVARKRIERGDTSGPISKNFAAEQGALTSFKQCLERNDSIMLSLTTFTHDNCFNIISPLADLDLHKFLHGEYHDFKERQQDFSPLNLLQELSCLAGALHFLHCNLRLRNKKIACAHLDFKPENILVKWSKASPVGQWLVTDFGTARIKEPSEASALAPGDFLTHFSLTKAQRNPGPYQAPEVQPGKDRVVGRESDLWSFGCLLASVLAFAIGGKEYVSGLAKSRYHASQLNETKTDYFYTHVNGKAVLKPSLTAWLDGLKTEKRDDRWIDKTLALIYQVLVEIPGKRLSALKTQAELDVISSEEEEFLKQKCTWRQPETPIIFDAPEVVGIQQHQHRSMLDMRTSMNQLQQPHQSRYTQQGHPPHSSHSNFTDSYQHFINGGMRQQTQHQNVQHWPVEHVPSSHPGQGIPHDQSFHQKQNITSGYQIQQNVGSGQYNHVREGLQYDQDNRQRPFLLPANNIPRGQATQLAQPVGHRNGWYQQNSGRSSSSTSAPQTINIPDVRNNVPNGERRTSTRDSSSYSMLSTQQSPSRTPSIVRSTTNTWEPISPSTSYHMSPNRSDDSSSFGNSSSSIADVSFLRLHVPDKPVRSAVCPDSTRVAFLSTSAATIHKLGNHNQWVPKRPPKQPDSTTSAYHAQPIPSPPGFEWDLISICGDFVILRAKNKIVKTTCQFFRYRCHLVHYDPTIKELWIEDPFPNVSHSINSIAGSVVDVAVDSSGNALFTLDSNLCYYSSTRGFHTLNTEQHWQVRRACFSNDGQRIFAWLSSPGGAKLQENSWCTWDSSTSGLIRQEKAPRRPAERKGSGKNNLIFPFSRSFAAFEIPDRVYIIENDSANRITQFRSPVEDVVAGVTYESIDAQARSQGLVLVKSKSPPRIVNLPLAPDVQSSQASKDQKLQEGFHEYTHAIAVMSDMTGSFVMISHPNGVIERRKVMSQFST